MKKRLALLLTAALCLILTGCGDPPPPEKAEDGLDWDESWVYVGELIGVDTPQGMDHRENNEALAANGMYYAAWSMGEAVPYTNADGDEAELYDAQVFLLLAKNKTAEDAEATLAEWQEMSKQQYDIEETDTQTHNGQDFSVITYSFDSETNPYARGASAYGVHQDCTISVELVCQEDFDGDAVQLLAEFLDNCHYAAS